METQFILDRYSSSVLILCLAASINNLTNLFAQSDNMCKIDMHQALSCVKVLSETQLLLHDFVVNLYSIK